MFLSNPFKSSFPESKLCGAFKTMFTLFGGTGMTNSEKEHVLRQYFVVFAVQVCFLCS